MASTFRSRDSYYDVRPEGEFGYGGATGGFVRSLYGLGRGILAGLLMFFGGVHVSGHADELVPHDSGLGALHEIVDQLSIGGLTGPIELIIGLGLFLTIRNPAIRLFSLLLMGGVIFGYANGYTLADMLGLLATLLKDAAGMLEQAAVNAA
jgi:hypothetical protein